MLKMKKKKNLTHLRSLIICLLHVLILKEKLVILQYIKQTKQFKHTCMV